MWRLLGCMTAKFPAVVMAMLRHKIVKTRRCWMTVLVNLRNDRLRRLQFSKSLRDDEHSSSKQSKGTGTPKDLAAGDFDAGRTRGSPKPL